MSHEDGDGVVVLPDVLVICRMDFGWQCVIEKRQRFLATSQIAPGSPMPGDGERGAVTLTAAAARELCLP
jgi:hypothetical protein